MLLDELPDELGLSDPGGTQNGAKDGLLQQGTTESTLQKHHQLSQLLSTTTPSSVQNSASPQLSLSQQQTAVANLAASLANSMATMKTPLANSLGSPPAGMNKGAPTSSNIPHSMNSDIIASTAYSSVGTSANNISMGGVVSMTNTMNMRPATSQGLVNSSGSSNLNLNMNQTPIMNGPHGILGPRNTMPNLQGTLSQTNANSNVVGNPIGNTITSSLGNNNQINAAGQQIPHPGLGANQSGIRVSYNFVKSNLCSVQIHLLTNMSWGY